MDEAKHVLVVKLPRAGEDAYVYVVDADASGALRSGLRAVLPDASVERLALIMSIAGASAGADAPYHYVVETDVLPEADADLNAWYDREHLPGLAAVPGTVHAWRYRNLDHGPRYHACYDLATRDTLGSAPWLAVRATAWSDRVRPAFRNTRRTMFRRLD
jgi:hypothetical protein